MHFPHGEKLDNPMVYKLMPFASSLAASSLPASPISAILRVAFMARFRRLAKDTIKNEAHTVSEGVHSSFPARYVSFVLSVEEIEGKIDITIYRPRGSHIGVRGHLNPHAKFCSVEPPRTHEKDSCDPCSLCSRRFDDVEPLHTHEKLSYDPS